jgi:hypothetical protein
VVAAIDVLTRRCCSDTQNTDCGRCFERLLCLLICCFGMSSALFCDECPVGCIGRSGGMVKRVHAVRLFDVQKAGELLYLFQAATVQHSYAAATCVGLNA